jgi:transcriptional regulator with PAS, ATPase and Fis domain
MEQCEVLVVYGEDSPSFQLQKILEEKEISVHMGRSWEEVAQICARVPLSRLKYIFIDLTLCSGHSWEQFLRRVLQGSSDTVVIGFSPQCPVGLYQLLNSSPQWASTPTEGKDTQFPGVVGKSAQFREVVDLARRYASSDITVLIAGETGTGKEGMARYIHAHSLRQQGPFVACNLAGIPETLIESELFGYVRGAFTGADKNKEGLVGAAEGGTLFLDEIGDLLPQVQLKLLRFLESWEFYKVGEASIKAADVRVIAATNQDLSKAMEEQRFRDDLYYRLSGAHILLPPLRERREDVLLLAEHFMGQLCGRMQTSGKKISHSAQVLLSEYSWPGNIRELKNAIESAFLIATGDSVTLADLPLHLQHYAVGHRQEISTDVGRSIDKAELEVIQAELRDTNGDKTEAAKRLGISIRTLYRKLEKLSRSDE